MLTDDPLESLLPISLIRAHIADDDTERFSVLQLSLYREAAFELCEKYTGLHLTGQSREITEAVDFPRGFSLEAAFAPRPRMHKLKHKAKTGLISVTTPSGTQQIVIAPGTSMVPLALINETIQFGSCRTNCDIPHQSTTFSYLAEGGIAPGQRLPAGLKIGMLQYIAFIVSNPGDNITHTTNSTAGSLDLSTNVDNALLVSGAISSWLPYCANRTR